MTTQPRYAVENRSGVCSIHGQYTNALVEQFGAEPIWYGCPRCHFDKRHAADISVRASGAMVHAERLLNAKLLDSCIPVRFQQATLENWSAGDDDAKARAWSAATGFVEAFAENYRVGRCMMLLGQVGCGKTHLATAILQQCIRYFGTQGVTGLYVTAGGIIRSVKETFGSQTKTESQIYADLIRPHLLVIDEVGLQNGTDFERQVLFEVINGRYEQLKPTIVVSNLSITDLKLSMGDRAVDRLRDRGGLVCVFRWPSARGAA
ncbi:DNA replication protein DnaC [Pseudomonas syringae pv. maculicola]|uniref:ATP-binding protein n=1 Tax=Pseudomonas syringae group genomosp. 3 TaxID=251701 RepID=UPI000F00DB45|nr:ATP-binding protein [Pseudomonas syringae group genomosp. 3]MBM0211854.1 ATP-binding protein [Pseudomonas syringae pv. maculicola]RMM83754.1 DNA replication protein DnaC [Pseudomonas syringae pv. maculicola]